MSKHGWIWKEDLLALLLILSDIASYNFDESDWDTVSYGLANTSSEENISFEYSLVGEIPISVKLANDPEQGIVIYNLTYPGMFQEKLELVEYIVDNFTLTSRHFNNWNK